MSRWTRRRWCIAGNHSRAWTRWPNLRSTACDSVTSIRGSVSGYHESGAKKRGLIETTVSNPGDWSEVVLKGPHFFVANAVCEAAAATWAAKTTCRPDHACRERSPSDRSIAVPATSTATAPPRTVAGSPISEPIARPYTEFYRLAWRRQIADNTERACIAAIIPPGPAHVDSCPQPGFRICQ